MASKKEKIPVFNYSSTESKNALTWERFMDENAKHEPVMPFSCAVSEYRPLVKYRKKKR